MTRERAQPGEREKRRTGRKPWNLLVSSSSASTWLFGKDSDGVEQVGRRRRRCLGASIERDGVSGSRKVEKAPKCTRAIPFCPLLRLLPSPRPMGLSEVLHSVPHRCLPVLREANDECYRRNNVKAATRKEDDDTERRGHTCSTASSDPSVGQRGTHTPSQDSYISNKPPLRSKYTPSSLVDIANKPF
jgi:hypothetical protein